MELVDIYRYSRLEAPTNIRLVRLFPATGNDDDQLGIELLEYDFATANGIYTALSYACGDTSIKLRLPVLCGGSKIMIYPTLYSALHKLRAISKSNLIWCDGLCIDQGQEVESLEERSQQVRMMFEIYSTAQEVKIDLGDDLGEKHEEFVAALYQLAEISRERYSSVAPYTFEYSNDEEDMKDHDAIGIIKSPTADKQEENTPTQDSHSIKSLISILPASVCQKWLWEAFATLLSRPYFKRLWVIQEHALGREVFFMLGESEIPGPIFVRGTNHLCNIQAVCGTEQNEVYEAKNHVQLPRFEHADKIFKTRLFRQESTSKDSYSRPETLIYETISFDCFDNRDKLYGLLGLCRPEDRQDPALRVDYSELVEKFTLRLSQYLLLHGAPFILYRSIGCNSASPLPSWAVNLAMRTNNHFSERMRVDGTCDDDLFNAGDDPKVTDKSNFQPSFAIDASPQYLIVSAILLPAVRSVSPVLPLSMEHTDYSIVILSTWFKDISKWALEQFSAIETNSKAVLSTITADTFHEMGRFHRASRYPDSPELATIVAAFYKWITYIDGSRPIDSDFAKVSTDAIPMTSSLIYLYGRRVANSDPCKVANHCCFSSLSLHSLEM